MRQHQQVELVTRNPVIKFGGAGWLLEPKIALAILEYDPSQFRKLLCLSPNWHYLVLEGLDELFK